MKPILFLSLALTLCSTYELKAQHIYQLHPDKDNTIQVLGTSNVHDWEMNATNPESTASFGSLSADSNVPQSLSQLSFTLDVERLKSEHSTMDIRTYKLLNTAAYPQITFKMDDALITPQGKNKFTVKANGKLTIAGVSNKIVLQVNAEVNPDQSITCSGTTHLKLTDYHMKPPSFMLGAMKVGNELDINYHLTYKK